MIIGNTYTDGSVRWKVKHTDSLTFDSGGITNIPLGSIVPYGINNNLPEGFLICNGAAISRQEYADLFDLIGTTYGSGDGSTTFNVPDLRNKFLEGSTTAGNNIAAGLPNINGRVLFRNWASGGHILDYATGPFTINYNYDNSDSIAASSTKQKMDMLSFDASHSSSVYGNSTTVQPPAVTVVYIIKALESDISLEHKHDLATTESDGFMSKEDKQYLNNLTEGSTFYTLPEISYSTLGLNNSTTGIKKYFELWLKYIVANYGDKVLSNKFIISTANPTYRGPVWGMSYASSATNGLPTYCSFLYIDPSGIIYNFTTMNGTYNIYQVSRTAI